MDTAEHRSDVKSDRLAYAQRLYTSIWAEAIKGLIRYVAVCDTAPQATAHQAWQSRGSMQQTK